MTTLLDRDRSARTLLAVRASAVAVGLVASVGLQVAGIDHAASSESPRLDGDCSAPVRPGLRAR
jgi:hypothetical protein